MEKNTELFNLEEVCRYFNLSESTIRRKICESREGKSNFPLPLFSSGCKVLWRKSDVINWSGEGSGVIPANDNKNNQTN